MTLQQLARRNGLPYEPVGNALRPDELVAEIGDALEYERQEMEPAIVWLLGSPYSYDWLRWL
jgi:hypothetical protein